MRSNQNNLRKMEFTSLLSAGRKTAVFQKAIRVY